MITQFKIFENINNSEPEVGDYVVVNYTPDMDKSPFTCNYRFIANKVGEIIDITSNKRFYLVKYTNLPKVIPSEYLVDTKSRKGTEIKYWDKDKNKLEALISSEKYNL